MVFPKTVCLKNVKSKLYVKSTTDSIHLNKDEGDIYEFITLDQLNDTTYLVHILHKNKFLNLFRGEINNGTSIILYGDKNNMDHFKDENNKWIIEYLNETTIAIRAFKHPIYINADSHTCDKDGGKIHMWGDEESKYWDLNQWEIVKPQIRKKYNTEALCFLAKASIFDQHIDDVYDVY